MKTRLLVGLLLLACTASITLADGSTWLQLAQDKPKADAPKAPAAKAVAEVKEEKVAESKKKCPFSISLDYTMISDYVFRGVNLSEYSREGREKLNHQFNINPEVDLGNYGTVGGIIWFEWFNAQQNLTPEYDRDIQEIDYGVYYRYTFEDIGLTTEVGWLAYTFPPVALDGHTDYEVYLKLSYDDKQIFGTKENILNPYVAYYQNIDLGACGSWWEMGISHEFALADYGMQNCPIMKHMALTPSLVYGIQHRLFGEFDPDLGKSTSAVNILFGLEIGFDLSGALNIPEEYGTLKLSGLLFFSQALDHAIAHDEFFGGMKIGYSW